MFNLDLKWKSIIFSILCVPLLIIVLLYYYYFLGFPDNSWFLNQTFINNWFYIIFLIFIPLPFLGVMLSEIGSLEKGIVFFIFLFLVFDIIQYSPLGLDSDQLFITLILAAFIIFSLDSMNFSINSRNNSPKIPLNNNQVVFNMTLIIITIICLFASYITDIYYIFLTIDYILIIILILLVLYKYRIKEML
ncbi:hypothetical protein [Methanobrevibacter filiformis]|uniref:Uncharacterized protein n=1 Tax=Methanobrevibacter filiformis TaxID=55758 RepID=A0A165ZF75_9EURY|nr:hypothetical protein [Methanobrevibacter filiformis]KZX10633.1 hypothetical protein MBFIL_16900 [Methanobrevibacter filiformis]